MSEAWIIDAVRSPRGRGKPGVGSLSNLHPQRCMAQVLNGLRDKVGFDPADIEDVVAGCGTGSGDHAHDIARMSVLDAGWPLTTTGVTLHRFCGSGQQAVTFAAMGVMSGHQDAVIGGERGVIGVYVFGCILHEDRYSWQEVHGLAFEHGEVSFISGHDVKDSRAVAEGNSLTPCIGFPAKCIMATSLTTYRRQ